MGVWKKSMHLAGNCRGRRSSQPFPRRDHRPQAQAGAGRCSQGSPGTRPGGSPGAAHLWWTVHCRSGTGARQVRRSRQDAHLSRRSGPAGTPRRIVQMVILTYVSQDRLSLFHLSMYDLAGPHPATELALPLGANSNVKAVSVGGQVGEYVRGRWFMGCQRTGPDSGVAEWASCSMSCPRTHRGARSRAPGCEAAVIQCSTSHLFYQRRRR